MPEPTPCREEPELQRNLQVKSFISDGLFWTTSFTSAKAEWDLIPQQDQVESEFVIEYAAILRKLLGPVTLSSV